ncbi:MAG: FIST signal transduction protein [Desulfomonilaceae bacterium]
MLKAATVRSNKTFSRKLGRVLGESLIEKLDAPPNACWFFCSVKSGMNDLLRGVCEAVGSLPLVGCTTDGEISSEGYSTGSAVLGGIISDNIQFEVGAVHGLGENCEKSGKELARQLGPQTRHIQIFTDGLTENGCAILRGLRSELGDEIPISGGAAGDSGKFQQTWQFHGSKVLSDSIVGIGLGGKFKLGAGVRSGWSPIGTAKKVTKAIGNTVYELNGQPALEVYERFLGRHAADLPSVGVEYPFGFLDSTGECGDFDQYILRATMSVNRNKGSIVFAGEIPEGSMIRITCGDYGSTLKAVEEAASQALEEIGEHSPSVIFFYSCMARKIVLGRRTREEVDRIRSVLGSKVPMIGFYSYGEYCRSRRGGPSLFHNETATVTVIGE